MQKRRLGVSDLEITPIGVGAWAMGGAGWQFAWGPQDDGESIAAIHAALDQGINWIDTAAIYGLGHSEEVVARAVRSAARKPYIFTKCSRRWNADGTIYSALSPASLAEELEGSLRRLVRHYALRPVDGFILAATSGEGMTLGMAGQVGLWGIAF